MQHGERERELMIQLATALKERDEARERARVAEAAWAKAKFRALPEYAQDTMDAVLARADVAESQVNASEMRRNAAESALAAARRECHEQCEAKEAAYSHIYKLRDALERCSELFSTIRGDWTDPRSECREGQDVIRAALGAPASAAGEDSK